MSRDNQKKIAVINDFCGFGRCSIAVSLPIISALKVQCCPLPTSIFSNHTAFDEYYFSDLTNGMGQYFEKWERLCLHYDGIYTGFLGSEHQVDIISDFIEKARKEYRYS